MSRIYRAKYHERGVEALEALLSHDPDVLLGDRGERNGIVSRKDYESLVALLNNLKSPFREQVSA